ncbi:MAG: hypothetical protein ABSB15_21340 [Bryobacteraceae bacterium]|jgi:hypothetical protein
MFVPYAMYTHIELALLRRQPDWSRWRSAIRERKAGFPFPFPVYPLTSGNAIHHAYHLCRLEIQTGLRIETFRTICEFGGGYGSMCRIARSLGFSGQYLIFDLPEFSALQRYYLGSVSADAVTISDLEQLSTRVERCGHPRLFIATWSLSESPTDVRQQVLDLMAGFDTFLIGYQDRFCEQDNEAFFGSLPSELPGISWEIRPLTHLPGNSYMFGRRVNAETRHQ